MSFAEHILQKVKDGKKRNELVDEYPTCTRIVDQFMLRRPHRTERTDILYIYGPSGVGKTTCVYSLLETLKKELGIEFYCKFGGLARFWDGYDNQDIVWIDDPTLVNENDKSAVSEFKNVMSTGHVYVEVKHSTMVFDSKLIIITSNVSPHNMAMSCGSENAAAMERRFTDTCGSYFVQNLEDFDYWQMVFCKLILRRFRKDIPDNIRNIINNVIIPENVTYLDIIENIRS